MSKILISDKYNLMYYEKQLFNLSQKAVQTNMVLCVKVIVPELISGYVSLGSYVP